MSIPPQQYWHTKTLKKREKLIEQSHKDLGDQQNPHLSTSFARQCDDRALARESKAWKISHSILPPTQLQPNSSDPWDSNGKGCLDGAHFAEEESSWPIPDYLLPKGPGKSPHVRCEILVMFYGICIGKSKMYEIWMCQIN